MQRITLTILVLALGLTLSTGTTHGGEIGHYAPGLPNIRDFAMPEPGFTAYSIIISTFPTVSTTVTATKSTPSPSTPAVGQA